MKNLITAYIFYTQSWTGGRHNGTKESGLLRSRAAAFRLAEKEYRKYRDTVKNQAKHVVTRHTSKPNPMMLISAKWPEADQKFEAWVQKIDHIIPHCTDDQCICKQHCHSLRRSMSKLRSVPWHFRAYMAQGMSPEQNVCSNSAPGPNQAGQNENENGPPRYSLSDETRPVIHVPSRRSSDHGAGCFSFFRRLPPTESNAHQASPVQPTVRQEAPTAASAPNSTTSEGQTPTQTATPVTPQAAAPANPVQSQPTVRSENRHNPGSPPPRPPRSPLRPPPPPLSARVRAPEPVRANAAQARLGGQTLSPNDSVDSFHTAMSQPISRVATPVQARPSGLTLSPNDSMDSFHTAMSPPISRVATPVQARIAGQTLSPNESVDSFHTAMSRP